MKQIRWVEASDLFEGFGYDKATSALASLLESGFDPEMDHPRLHVNFDNGQGLLMPSEIGDRVGLKFVTVAPSNPAQGLDRIQGIFSLLDSATLTPLLQCDGAALTLLRTASMTAATVQRLSPPEKPSTAIFGSGPQAVAHALALRHATSTNQIHLFARNPTTSQAVISRLVSEGFDASIGDSGQLANADIVITATSSGQPLFAADDVKTNAIIAAVGSHDPNSRELPGELMASGSVYVESRDSALREAGDVVMAISEGHLAESALIELKELFGSSVDVDEDERRIYKSTGMSWQDLAIMAAVEKEL